MSRSQVMCFFLLNLCTIFSQNLVTVRSYFKTHFWWGDNLRASKLLETVNASWGLYSYSQQSYQLMSVNNIIINIINHTRSLYYSYTLYRENQAIDRVAICRNTNPPNKGNSQVSAKPMKVIKHPEYYWSESTKNVDKINTLDGQQWVWNSNHWLLNEDT